MRSRLELFQPLNLNKFFDPRKKGRKENFYMNVEKYSLNDCARMFAHYERKNPSGYYSNQSIDTNRIKDNYNLAPNRDISSIDYLRKKLEEIPHLHRDNLVTMADVVVSAPKTLAPEFHDKFFYLTYEFLVERYGGKSGFKNPEDIVISACVHKDEILKDGGPTGGSVHMHFSFLPIIDLKDKGQRFRCKDVINVKDLSTLHQDLEKFLSENGLYAEVLNGKTQFDSHGRALSVKELKKRDRGPKIKRKISRWG